MVTLEQSSKPGLQTGATTKVRVFDCDVHPAPGRGLENLKPYLSTAWQERFARKNATHDGLNVAIRVRHPNRSVVRRDPRTHHATQRPDPQRLILWKPGLVRVSFLHEGRRDVSTMVGSASVIAAPFRADGFNGRRPATAQKEGEI